MDGIKYFEQQIELPIGLIKKYHYRERERDSQ